jgi:large subunit ribosomal protein L10
MKRAEKVDSVQELQNDLGRATVTVLAEYRGLTVTQMNRFRRAVRDADGRCRVAKNTLAKRAVTSSRYERLTPLLRGPMALIIGFKDPVAIAKLAVKFAELDGQVLPPAEVKALATLPSREVVIAQLLGLLQAPATQLLRTLNEPAARVARLVDALGKRRESAEGGAAS